MATFQDMLFAAAGVSGSGWISRLSGTSDISVYAVAADPSSGDVFSAGFTTGSSEDAVLVKRNSSGVLQWQRRLYGSYQDQAIGLALDSSGNSFISGVFSGAPVNKAYVAKYNSSGTLKWQRTLGHTLNVGGEKCAVDASGNVLVAGSVTVSTTTYGFVAKYNTSGTIQWQRMYAGTGAYCIAKGVGCDSSSNVYVLYADNSGGHANLVKYNSSGVLQWQRRLSPTAFGGANGLHVDSSGTCWITLHLTSGSYTAACLAKYNSSGTLQWQKQLASASSNVWLSDVAVDAAGLIYVAGEQGGTPVKGLFAQYSAAGAVMWLRRVFKPTDGGSLWSVCTHGDHIIVGGDVDNGADDNGLCMKATAGAPQTGSFNVGGTTITVESTTLTESTPTHTEAAGGGTDSAGTMTDAAGTMTSATTTLTNNLLNF